ncbi:MAG: primosomal protein N' [Phycisphaerales bacterium JB065]
MNDPRLFEIKPVPDRDGERAILSDPAEQTRFVAIVPERGIESVSGAFTYKESDNVSSLEIGDRVRIPLGRGNTPVSGIVVAVDCPPPDTKGPVKAVLSREGHALNPSLIRLSEWLARYYCCPVGMVLATMLPAAVKKGTGRRRQVTLRPPGIPPEQVVQVLTPTAREAWESYIARFGGDPARWPRLTKKSLVSELGLKSAAPLGRLLKAGVLIEEERMVVRGSVEADYAQASGAPEPPLTPDQQAAIEAITPTLGTFATHLILGVTGSGKTEVYLQLLRRVLDRGQSGLVLVPEISLTPQTAGRFVQRFASEDIGVAVLHSGLTASQRHAEWRRVESGEARIVIGARSAVFAPFPEGEGQPSLGIVIVDEEHDGSYKQDQLPRYHARDVALKRAQMVGCPVVLGSATPSLESWHNARSGRYQLIEMPRRVGGGVLPHVRIVDLAEERRNRVVDSHKQHAIGPTLEGHIAQTLKKPVGDGGQILLLLNRRGFAHYVCCADQKCGWKLECDQCTSTMVFHKNRLPQSRSGSGGYLKCHHCLSMQELPLQCPRCAKKLILFGSGTQRLEAELKAKFGLEQDEADGLLRLDSDTMNSAKDYFSALERFRTGQVRMLIGTQMIAKGLDFPNVSLVGVISADTALATPDFRAGERAFQLVAQVAGRAGRASSGGRVIVQTMEPEHPAILAAAQHDYRSFADAELEFRRAFGLPPVGRMARLIFRDQDPEKAGKRAWEVSREIQAIRADPQAGLADLNTKGPMDAPMARVAGFYRVAIELLAPSAGQIQRVLTALRSRGLVKSDASCAVDVDPISML